MQWRFWSRHAFRDSPQAQDAFRVLLIHGILQFTVLIPCRCALHCCSSRGTHRSKAQQKTCKTCFPTPPKFSPAQLQTSENQRSERPWTPQRAHEAPQRCPTGSKTCPREPQKRPRGAKRRSRAPKSRPRAAQESPRPVQNRVLRAFRAVLGTIFVGSSVRTALESILLRFSAYTQC